MNFSEIFRKYDKVVESFVKKTTSKTTRDIIKVADKYVRKDEEILRQLKEFIKQDGNNEEGFGFRIDLPGIWSIEQQNNEGEFEDWCIIELNLITSMVDGMYTYSVIDLGDEDSYVEVVAVSDDYAYCVSVRWEELDVKIRNGILNYLNFTDLRYDQINESFTKKIKSSRKNTLKESFTKKISSKKNTDLISKSSFVLEDGVYILHETLGVRGVEGWNPKNNDGVIGILVVEDEHQLVVALEDSPEELQWSEERKLVNQSIEYEEDAESDFNGEEYCRNLNSPEYPAAYYCLNYKKGGRDWYLPSIGELLLVRRHLEEIQSALSIVGGQKFVTDWKGVGMPLYWSSTESDDKRVWCMYPKDFECLYLWKDKLIRRCEVRPVSNFCKNTLKESFTKKIKSTCKKNPLKESFTKKISSKKNTDLISEQSFVLEDGTYILHETLGVKTVEGWNPKNNDGVIGILLVEDEHQLVVALEDSPNYLIWSEEDGLVNQPIRNEKNAKSDFNGEKYCRNLNSPEYPAVYYCLNYNKGGRDWYLPSTGELWMIYQHLEEVQTALSIVGGQKFVMDWVDDNIPWYWSSTEVPIFDARHHAWAGCAFYSEVNWCTKKSLLNVRPVSNFCKKNTLKESFTKKIKNQTSKNIIDNADIKMTAPLTFEDDEVSNIFFNEVVDVEDYEGGVYTLEDASIDSHKENHNGFYASLSYFPFYNQRHSWHDNDKIVRFHELRFFTGLKTLPEYAFVNCTSFEEVSLPDNLEQIRKGAFANCISLKTVRMPKNRTLRFIDDSAFANTGLVSVVIPDGVEVIGECAFADCNYLESVVIPPSVKKIERGAFSRCPKLKSVSGIESVQDVGPDVFYGCNFGKDFLDSSVFGKFVTLREFNNILFSADWLYDSDAMYERFLESYCLNHYDTDDYKHITDEEWEDDEFNPDSPYFNKRLFDERATNYAGDEVSMEWDDLKDNLKYEIKGRNGGWICPEDDERFSSFDSAFNYCIPDSADWINLKVEQVGGSLIVCGTEIVPECDRYIDDELDSIYPNEFIDYKSLRFCDPIEKEISL